MTPITSKVDGTVLKCSAHEEMIVGMTALNVAFKDFRDSIERHNEKTDQLIKEIATANSLFVEKVLTHLTNVKEDSREYTRTEDTKLWHRFEIMDVELGDAVEERNEKLAKMEEKFTNELGILRQTVEKLDKRILYWGGGLGGAMVVLNIVFWLLKSGILKIHI